MAGWPGDSHTPALERELTYEVTEEARVGHGGDRTDTRTCSRLLERQRVTEHTHPHAAHAAHTAHTPICLLSLEEFYWRDEKVRFLRKEAVRIQEREGQA